MADQIIVNASQLDRLAQQLSKLSSSMSDVEAKIRALRIPEEGGGTLQVRLPGAPLRSVPYNLSSGDVSQCLRSLANGLDQLEQRAKRAANAVQYTREGFAHVERSIAQLFKGEIPEDWRNDDALTASQSATTTESPNAAAPAETPARSMVEEARTPGTELNDLYREIFGLRTSIYVMTQKEILNEYTKDKQWLAYVESGYNVLRPTDWKKLDEDARRATVLGYLDLNDEVDSLRSQYMEALLGGLDFADKSLNAIADLTENTKLGIAGMYSEYINKITQIQTEASEQRCLYAYVAADAMATVQRLQALKEKLPEYGAVCDDMITKVNEAAQQRFDAIEAQTNEACFEALCGFFQNGAKKIGEETLTVIAEYAPDIVAEKIKDTALKEGTKTVINSVTGIAGEAISSGISVWGTIELGINIGNMIGDAMGAGECIHSRHAMVTMTAQESNLRSKMVKAYCSDPSPERDAELYTYTKMYLSALREGNKTAQGLSKEKASLFVEGGKEVDAMIQRLDALWAKK